MAEQKKKELLKNIMTNLGITMILVGSTAIRSGDIAFFFMGLILLGITVLDIKGLDAKRRIPVEIMLSGTLIISSITQLVMTKGFKAPQAFLVVLLLGSIMVLVESLRKLADMD